MNEMCILEHVIDVENCKAICKSSRVISLTKIDCFLYIFDGHLFSMIVALLKC